MSKSTELTTIGIQRQFPMEKYNTLLPTVAVEEIPECFKISVSVVQINADDKAMAYPLPGGKWGLTKTSLDMLANAAGVRFGPESIVRVDGRTHPHYCEFRVTATVTDLDGTVRTGTASKTIDLRADAGDGMPGKDVPGMTKERLAGARGFIDGHCESKARNRAISSVLGIKRAYAKDELKKPFVVPRLALDARDPDAKQVMLATAVGAVNALFGAQQLSTPPAEEPPPPVRVEVTNDDSIPDYPELDAVPTTAVKALPAPPPPAEKDEAAEVVCRVTAIWKRSQEINKDKKFWDEILDGCASPAKAADMTLVDVQRIEAAVNMLYAQAPVGVTKEAP